MFRRTTLLFLLITLLPSAAFAQQFWSLHGTLVDVHDGDTFRLKLNLQDRIFFKEALKPEEFRSGQVRIRLKGIDAPELSDPRIGNNSKAFLSAGLRLRPSITVLVRVALKSFERSFDRIVGIVYLGNVNANLEMLWGGHAKDVPEYSLGRAAVAAQWHAMNKRKGVWSDPKQYQAENEYRMWLYGTAPRKPRIYLVPVPSRSKKPGQTRVEKQGWNPGAGKVDWQNGFKGFPNLGVGKAEWQRR